MKWHVRAAAAAKSLQSCLALLNPIDGSPPGSPAPGIHYQCPYLRLIETQIDSSVHLVSLFYLITKCMGEN